jgi:hypothetical protein
MRAGWQEEAPASEGTNKNLQKKLQLLRKKITGKAHEFPNNINRQDCNLHT